MESIKVRKLVALMVVATAFAVTWLFVTQADPGSKDTHDQLPLVEITVAQEQSYSPYVRLLGSVRSREISQMSSPVAATVLSLPIAEGQTVSADQIIAQLDTRKAQYALTAQRANSERLQAEIEELAQRHHRNKENLLKRTRLLSLSRKRLQRQEELHRSQVGSASQRDTEEQRLIAEQLLVDELQFAIDSYSNNHAALSNQLRSSIANEAQLQLDLQQLTIKAPYKGVVMKRHVATGERVSANQAIISLYNSDALEVVAKIPMEVVATLKSALNNDQLLAASELHSAEQLTLNYIAEVVDSGELGQKAFFNLSPQTQYVHNSKVLFDLSLPALQAIAIPEAGLYNNKEIYEISAQGQLIQHQVLPLGRAKNGTQQRQVLIKSTPELEGKTFLAQYLSNARTGLSVRVP